MQCVLLNDLIVLVHTAMQSKHRLFALLLIPFGHQGEYTHLTYVGWNHPERRCQVFENTCRGHHRLRPSTKDNRCFQHTCTP